MRTPVARPASLCPYGASSRGAESYLGVTLIEVCTEVCTMCASRERMYPPDPLDKPNPLSDAARKAHTGFEPVPPP
jgi:hypothetical protein